MIDSQNTIVMTDRGLQDSTSVSSSSPGSPGSPKSPQSPKSSRSSRSPTIPTSPAYSRSPSSPSNVSTNTIITTNVPAYNASNTYSFSLWSSYINDERACLVQEYPKLDRSIIGGFISNVFKRISQNQDQGRESLNGNADDEWHTALLDEFSALREPTNVRIFANFISRVLRRASEHGLVSFHPGNRSSSRRNSSAWQPDSQRLPPIITLPLNQENLLLPASMSPPKTTSHLSTTPSVTTQTNCHHSRSGTDPHLFSLETSSPVKPDFSLSYLTRPMPNRPTSMPSSTRPPSYSVSSSAPTNTLPLKRSADDYLSQPPLRYHAISPGVSESMPKKSEDMTMAAMLIEATALSAVLGDKAQGGVIGEGRSLACLRCRKKKTRCNHARPTCSRCAHSGFKCEYPDPLPKPTDMASSIAKLQGQLQALNSRILAVEKND